jgi:hypothetical protein
MKIPEWAEEHWDVLAIVAALLFAVASAGLGVAGNVAAVGLGPSAPPPAADLRSPPAGLELDPARQPAPVT